MSLKEKKIAILIENLYEDIEFWYCYYRLIEEEAEITVVGPAGNTLYKSKHDYPVSSTARAEDLTPSKFDAVIIPGGYAPDKIRRFPSMVNFVKSIFNSGGVVAFICHGGWVPISAGILKGKKVTGFFSIKDDLMNAGGIYSDQPVVRDGNLISSRIPADLPLFCKEIINVVIENNKNH